MRIRKNAGNLPTWDPILLWYAKAIREMQTRPITDPLSWRYQAAIHDYDQASDPLHVPGEAMPTAAQQTKFWSRCQHGSWFFLSWHRAYLLFFERTVAATVAHLGGPADWALPFWNYGNTANPNARKLPAAFQAATLPDGTPNPLRVQFRAPAANTNLPVGSANDANDTQCLSRPRFINSALVAQFGGGRTGFSHNGGVAGACERVPHATMHGAVGGAGGWMSAFNTAALDPIFWLHHANIDRLWELWRRTSATHLDPPDVQWRTGVTFDFHDAAGNPVTITSNQVVDIKKPLLDYDYEGLPAAVPVTEEIPEAAMETPEAIPEMVGATSEAVTLGNEPQHVQMAISAPTGPGVLETVGERKTIHLVLENIRATKLPIESYEVYVNLPAGAKPSDHPELMAGLLPMFGIVEASRPGTEHGGAGVNLSLDITDIVDRLTARNAWDPAKMQVSFQPHRCEGDRDYDMEMAPIQVGRISLYVA